jgi:O-succinylbenzoic acid--CoA ligase
MIPEIHPDFRLNGQYYDRTNLISKAYCLVKEGQNWEQQIGDFLLNWMDDFSYLTVKTSGSTGKPKEIKLDKKAMLHSAELTGKFLDLDSGSKALCCLPLSYIAGKMMLIRAIHLGWHIDVCEPTANPFSKIDENYDFTALVPLQLKSSLKNLDQVSTVIVGGAALNQKLLDKLSQVENTSIYQTYGMTETSSHVAIRQIAPAFEECYRPLKGVELSTTEDHRLIIKCDPILSKPLETNDLVELMDDQSFKLLGRVDEVINTGGVKVHPGLVENKLRIRSNRRFFIHGLPHDDLGEQVTLFVEGKKELDLSKAYEDLSDYEKPKEVFYLKQFLETHTKKIDKQATVDKFVMAVS